MWLKIVWLVRPRFQNIPSAQGCAENWNDGVAIKLCNTSQKSITLPQSDLNPDKCFLPIFWKGATRLLKMIFPAVWAAPTVIERWHTIRYGPPTDPLQYSLHSKHKHHHHPNHHHHSTFFSSNKVLIGSSSSSSWAPLSSFLWASSPPIYPASSSFPNYGTSLPDQWQSIPLLEEVLEFLSGKRKTF